LEALAALTSCFAAGTLSIDSATCAPGALSRKNNRTCPIAALTADAWRDVESNSVLSVLPFVQVSIGLWLRKTRDPQPRACPRTITWSEIFFEGEFLDGAHESSHMRATARTRSNEKTAMAFCTIVGLICVWC
jgi:hypothetical protein